MESILQLDTDILIYLNSIRSLLWDNFFWIYTSTIIWVPLYVAITYVLFKRMGWQAVWVLLAVALTITLCDQISSSIFKPLFARPRPTREPHLEGILQLINDYRAGRFGFVSGHATNSFGLAIFLSLIFRKKYFAIFIYVWASLNAYSRIYAGVHYPGDILGGIILGTFIGWGVFKLYEYITIRHPKTNSIRETKFGSEVQFAVAVGVLSFVMIFLSSKILLKIMS
ncbi:phosphatase PAP2 family protein [Alkalitalea saponilacus]|uniref:Undecaprenyl-diphosphatase n=1 Tax=Alkalitalea saponilacus TaxID=889453 RepID=A0A1T5HTC4_9BACT|nr:phosphatase PAP2 family protein [Alkalitalea saponilacus]ASB50219.1 phospholipid phosphatase [Alkalitalea saponilacus]SKC23926.1 undecaprenyl-diphosphatase [Alkalitalea saponilacus]